MSTTLAEAPAVEVAEKSPVDHVNDALVALGKIDLRTIKNAPARIAVRDARDLLKSARKGVKG